MITYTLIYYVIGLLWTEWLEYFCSNNLEGKLAEPFTFKEKIIQTAFWPAFIAIFIFNFLDDLFKKL